MSEKSKSGRPPLNGERALTKAERQHRWRQNAAAKGRVKVQMTITLDTTTAAMIDAMAEHMFHESRNETIRIMLTARMAQLEEMAKVMEVVEDCFSPAPFKDSLNQVRDRHRLMVRGPMCAHDVKKISQGHLAQLEAALREATEKFQGIPTDHIEKSADEIAGLRANLNGPL